MLAGIVHPETFLSYFYYKLCVLSFLTDAKT